MSPKRAARRDKFKRIAEDRRLLTPNEIAWRERLGDHEYEFHPVEVKYLSVPGSDEPEYVQRLYGPQLKTVQFIRTVRLTP